MRCRTTWGTLVIGIALVATGCGASEPTLTTSTETRATTTPTAEPTTVPTTSPTTATTTAPPTPTTRPTGPAGKQVMLGAETLPAPPGITWKSQGVKAGEGQSTASVCQVASLVSIGATKVFTEDFTGGSATTSATQLVAKFADEDSAMRAYAVLDAWERNCGKRLKQQDLKPLNLPGGLSPIAVDGGRAGFGVLFFTDDPSSDEAQIEPQVAVVKGEYVSWVVFRQVGQDYNYEAGQSPPERAAPLMDDAMP